MIFMNYILFFIFIYTGYTVNKIYSQTNGNNAPDDEYIYLEISNIDVAYQGYIDFSVPSKKHYFHYNMEIPFSYVTKYSVNQGYFQTSDIDFSSKINVSLFNNEQLIAHTLKSSMYFSKIKTNPKLEKFTFLFFPTTAVADTLSLAHNFISDEYNLIERLYKENIITKRKFSFYINSAFTGELILGEIPSSIKSKFKYKSQCNVVKQNKENIWSCNLDSIKIKGGKDKLDINYYVQKDNKISYFQTTDKSIKVPRYFFDYINETIFTEYLNKNICNSHTIGLKHFFKCECEETYPFPTFYFEFEGMTIVLDRDMIFQDYITVCYFQIETWDDLSNNEWVFGIPVFKMFIPEFNFDEEVITFYSKDRSILNLKESNLNISKLNIIIYTFKFNMLLLSVCSIFIFIAKYTK